MLRIHHQEWMVKLAESALHAESGRVLVDLAESAPRAEPEHEQDDRSSATSSECSDSDEEPHDESPPATQVPQAADAEPSAPDIVDITEQFNAQVKAVLAFAQASADNASAAATRAHASADSAGLAQRLAECAQGRAELAERRAGLKALEAANPRAKRILDLAADHASAGPQPSEASRPSRCTRSRVPRSYFA